MEKSIEHTITNAIRKEWIDLMDRSLASFRDGFKKELTRRPGLGLMKPSEKVRIVDGVLRDLRLVNKLLLKMEECGRPANLIFIDGEGTLHDIAGERQITPEDLINAVLDNTKLQSHGKSGR